MSAITFPPSSESLGKLGAVTLPLLVAPNEPSRFSFRPVETAVQIPSASEASSTSCTLTVDVAVSERRLRANETVAEPFSTW